MSTAIYTKEFTGGLIWGTGYFRRFSIPYPFAKLRIEDEFIVLSAVRTKFCLSRVEILGIEVKFALLAKGLKFHHQRKDYPSQIKFLTFQSDEILSILNDVPRI